MVSVAEDMLGLEDVGRPGGVSWLDPEAFLREPFDVQECIVDLRRHAPLVVVKTELEQYLSFLKAKLVEVINDDYSSYASLSTRLVNLDSTAVRIRKPLQELKDKLSKVEEGVRGELEALNQGLERRKDVATARSLLELMQEVAYVVSKVEQLLSELKDSQVAPSTASSSSGVTGTGGPSQSDPAELAAHCVLLERIAAEINRVQFLAAKGQDLAFIRNLLSRVANSRTQLLEYLRSALTTSVRLHRSRAPGSPMGDPSQDPAWSAVLQCLRAYVELGETGGAEEVIRTVVVAPLVQQQMEEYKRALPSTGGQADDLSGVLGPLWSSLQGSCGPLLAATLSRQSGLHTLNILGNAILAEVVRLIDTLPGMCSPGVPISFHGNFRAALQFLDVLESCCHTRAAVDRFRGSTAYGTFLKKWNVGVYFSLLYQEIAGELEDAVAQERLGPTPSTKGSSFYLPVTRKLWQCLERCGSPDVYLDLLADKFFKLTLQLLARYTSWVRLVGASKRDPSGPASLPWVADQGVEVLAVAYQDVGALAMAIQQQTISTWKALVEPWAGLEDVVETGLKDCAEALDAAAQSLLGVMAAEVIDKCVAVVQPLKGIIATYTRTSKMAPTRHNHYVAGILDPLRTLLGSKQLVAVTGTAKLQLIRHVVDAVNIQYMNLADELLTNVRKMENSLKRFKKNVPAEDTSTGDGVNMSDSDKSCLQLLLDVQEHGNQLAKVGLDLASLDTYQKLLSCVTPPGK